MENTILAHRHKLFRTLLEQHHLNHALVLNLVDGVLGTWFLGSQFYPPRPQGDSLIPIQLPFNRNTVLIVSKEGEIQRYDQVAPHPTDPQHHPLLSSVQLDNVFGHCPVGIIRGGWLKKPVRDALKRSYPGLAFVDLTDEFEAVKAQKCPEEVENMELAARFFDKVFSAVPLTIREGHTEHDAAADIRFRFYQMKASAEDMQQLIRLKIRSAPAGGASIPAPLAYPGRRFTWGDRVNVAVSGFAPSGYTAALGRCFTVGPADEETRHYWELAVRAQDIAAAKLRPGVCLHDVLPELESEIWRVNNLEPDRFCWLCGMGTDRGEAPRVNDDSSFIPLSAGMTLAIGPKITPKGQDSYCCLDMYTVTENGCQRISSTPRKLIEVLI